MKVSELLRVLANLTLVALIPLWLPVVAFLISPIAIFSIVASGFSANNGWNKRFFWE